MSKFKIGDKVIYKSKPAVRMVVVGIGEEDLIECEWLDDKNTPKRDKFIEAALEEYKGLAKGVRIE
jgi:uncharacterized protein YodC (DUF2158 family)